MLTKSGEKQRLVSCAPRPTSVRPLQVKLPSPILQLQRTLGNRRLAQLILAKRVTPQGKIIDLQRKLTVDTADDQYEQEADHVARQVMSMPAAGSPGAMQPGMPPEEEKDKTLQTKPLGASITPFAQRETGSPEEVEDKDKEKKRELQTKRAEEGIALQRQPETKEEEKKPIQARAAGSQADSFEAGDDVESRFIQSKGGGSLLPDSVRACMEPRFGTDFSHVRVHTGNEAMQMNRDVGAQAFTHGSDIYYGANHYPGNLELTTHELTHVVQETGGAPLQTKHSDDLHLVRQHHLAATQSTKEKNAAYSIARYPAFNKKQFYSEILKTETNPTFLTRDVFYQNTRHFANCDGVNITGHTDANYSDSYTSPGSSTARQGCTGCSADECIANKGTVISVFNTNPQITLPPVPAGLNKCERIAVQNFINKTLQAHEKQHVAAFNTYRGTIKTRYTYKGCASGLDAHTQQIHDQIEASRKASADSTSAALDANGANNFTITCKCPDPEPSADAETNPDTPIAE